MHLCWVPLLLFLTQTKSRPLSSVASCSALLTMMPYDVRHTPPFLRTWRRSRSRSRFDWEWYSYTLIPGALFTQFNDWSNDWILILTKPKPKYDLCPLLFGRTSKQRVLACIHKKLVYITNRHKHKTTMATLILDWCQQTMATYISGISRWWPHVRITGISIKFKCSICTVSDIPVSVTNTTINTRYHRCLDTTRELHIIPYAELWILTNEDIQFTN